MAPTPPALPAAIFYALTFPVQRPQLFVLSWPYFPQLQARGASGCCCRAAAAVLLSVLRSRPLPRGCRCCCRVCAAGFAPAPTARRPAACPPSALQLIGRAAAVELGLDISEYPTYSSDQLG